MAQRKNEIELTIGELIRRTRRNHDMNQELAGRELKVSQSTVAKWERGDRPAPEKIPRIAQFVGMPLPQLLQLYHGTKDVGYAATIGEINDRMHEMVALLDPLLRRVVDLESQVKALTEGSDSPPKRGVRMSRRSTDTPKRTRSTSRR